MSRLDTLLSFISEDGNDPFNHYALALEYMSVGDFTNAKKTFEKLLKDFPDYLPTYYQAAHFYWDAGDLRRTDLTFTSGIELAKSQDDAKALAELSSAYQNFLIDTE